MLVLTRKLDESILISDNIKITVLRVKGNTVRIGIEAPRDVRIVRSELGAADAPSTNQKMRDGLTSELGTCESDEKLRTSTVTAIVDSPTIAGPRLYVGTVAKDGSSVNLTSDLDCDGPAVSGFAHDPLLTRDQAAPLRAFLRSGRGLTAV